MLIKVFLRWLKKRQNAELRQYCKVQKVVRILIVLQYFHWLLRGKDFRIIILMSATEHLYVSWISDKKAPQSMTYYSCCVENLLWNTYCTYCAQNIACDIIVVKLIIFNKQLIIHKNIFTLKACWMYVNIFFTHNEINLFILVRSGQ